MSFINKNQSFVINKIKLIIVKIIIIIVMLSEMCVLCEELTNKGIICKTEITSASDKDLLPPFREYFMEHGISQMAATQTFDLMKDDLLNSNPPAWCSSCTAKDKKYCLSTQIIHDHCCCDHQHEKEELPWIPHTCYVGHEQCESYTGSCLVYIELKECCCNKFLAEHWKSLYSHATTLTTFAVVLVAIFSNAINYIFFKLIIF